jgi:hypothetical protein
MLDKRTFEQVPLEVVQKVVEEEMRRARKKKEPRRTTPDAKLAPMENSSEEKKGKA